MNSLKFVKSLRVVKKIKIKDNEYILNTGDTAIIFRNTFIVILHAIT